ncbi:hypothetical protein E3N88_34478 [Mikania micrantha]|uniref:Uncharacterized protein n=1 Tax=Mikania micrantha TaxID=192012 RepID=A0A5N6LYE1_9ASTR|nr:hypothetical protein E3N88_34478 [Mikania micrantha]
MASKTLLFLALTFAVVLLIASEVAADKDTASNHDRPYIDHAKNGFVVMLTTVEDTAMADMEDTEVMEDTGEVAAVEDTAEVAVAMAVAGTVAVAMEDVTAEEAAGAAPHLKRQLLTNNLRTDDHVGFRMKHA